MPPKILHPTNLPTVTIPVRTSLLPNTDFYSSRGVQFYRAPLCLAFIYLFFHRETRIAISSSGTRIGDRMRKMLPTSHSKIQMTAAAVKTSGRQLSVEKLP